ncbi:MAG: YggT family protein [bacterium]|nr:YggT family protein [bacterium]
MSLCSLWPVVGKVLVLYSYAMLVYALVSWVPQLRGRWSDALGSIIEPVLAPVRRIIPSLGGLDLSFLVVFILVQFIARRLLTTACF